MMIIQKIETQKKHILHIVFILFSSLILIGSVASQEPKAENSFRKSIQDSLDYLVKEQHLPGINFSIILKEGKQFNFSSGMSDTLNKVNLTPEHVMFSGSIGKTYAVAVLMQLADSGKVDLSKKYIDYFPDNEWLKHIPNIEDINVEMLLQHTSGLPRYIEYQAVWDSLQQNPDKVWSYKDRLMYIFDQAPVHEARKGWAYSDTGYLLIGMLIEKITDSYYYDVVQERILTPLALNHTHASLKRDMPNLSVAYSNLDTFFRMPGTMVSDGKYAFNPQMEWTGGGMASTTSDLALWADYYYTGKVFSQKSLEKIITVNEQGTEVFENTDYGAGSFIYKTKLGKAYGHTGFMPGFKSIFAYFPEQQISVALQINCDYAAQNFSLVNYLETILSGIKPLKNESQ